MVEVLWVTRRAESLGWLFSIEPRSDRLGRSVMGHDIEMWGLQVHPGPMRCATAY